MTRSGFETRRSVRAAKQKPRIGIALLRILGCIITPPLVAYAVIFIMADPNIRSAYFEEFTGFDRALIATHLPKGPDTRSKQGANVLGNEAEQAWNRIHPRFAELPAKEQVGRIESLLAKERNGAPVPALFELRKATSFPATSAFEVHSLNREKWLALIVGSSIAVFLVIQCGISLLALAFKGSRRRVQSPDTESMIGAMSGRYESSRAYHRR